MKHLWIVLGTLLLSPSALAAPAQCHATAELKNDHIILHVDAEQCAEVLYMVGPELTSITIHGGDGGSDHLLSYYDKPNIAVVSCTAC